MRVDTVPKVKAPRQIAIADVTGKRKPSEKKSAAGASVPRTDSKDLLKRVPKLKKIKLGRGNR